eukprot:m.134132 g.134132  ORF g.134132 m.134132 type:complete len:630 (-) comp14841_c0_seq1:98-1987(-)
MDSEWRAGPLSTLHMNNRKRPGQDLFGGRKDSSFVYARDPAGPPQRMVPGNFVRTANGLPASTTSARPVPASGAGGPTRTAMAGTEAEGEAVDWDELADYNLDDDDDEDIPPTGLPVPPSQSQAVFVAASAPPAPTHSQTILPSQPAHTTHGISSPDNNALILARKDAEIRMLREHLEAAKKHQRDQIQTQDVARHRETERHEQQIKEAHREIEALRSQLAFKNQEIQVLDHARPQKHETQDTAVQAAFDEAAAAPPALVARPASPATILLGLNYAELLSRPACAALRAHFSPALAQLCGPASDDGRALARLLAGALPALTALDAAVALGQAVRALAVLAATAAGARDELATPTPASQELFALIRTLAARPAAHLVLLDCVELLRALLPALVAARHADYLGLVTGPLMTLVAPETPPALLAAVLLLTLDTAVTLGSAGLTTVNVLSRIAACMPLALAPATSSLTRPAPAALLAATAAARCLVALAPARPEASDNDILMSLAATLGNLADAPDPLLSDLVALLEPCLALLRLMLRPVLEPSQSALLLLLASSRSLCQKLEALVTPDAPARPLHAFTCNGIRRAAPRPATTTADLNWLATEMHALYEALWALQGVDDTPAQATRTLAEESS